MSAVLGGQVEPAASPFDMQSPAVEMRTCQASVLRSMLETLKELVDTTNLVFDDEGLSIASLDSSHVSFVSVRVHAAGLEGELRTKRRTPPPCPRLRPARRPATRPPRPARRPCPQSTAATAPSRWASR